MPGLRRDSKVEKWERDLENIKNAVLGLHHNRNVYRTVGKIVDDNGTLPPSHFFNYAQHRYAITQCAAIRRQAEVYPSRVVSLASLLAEIADEPERMTRERYIALHEDPDPYFQELAEKIFTEKFVGDVGNHIDPAIVESDLAKLRDAAETIEKHTDRNIAHADREGAKALATFGEIDTAIDVIGELFRKYALLLTAAGWATLEPVPQEDWLAVFRQPWIRQDT
jgi:hypothetical protein